MPVAEQISLTGSEPKKLVLCFDGTGNSFSGSNADTNVVKILSKLDRNHPDQFHYYQTGIGTYDIGDEKINKSWFGEFKSSISQTLDEGFGTTFDAHVLAGYRFLMRYYEPGAKIYMFGFSRGAFTAKFLARLVHTVGLLCKGNEEMVPFAYKLYQRYLAGDIKDRTIASEQQQHQHHHWRWGNGREANEGDDDDDCSDSEAQVGGPQNDSESAPLLRDIFAGAEPAEIPHSKRTTEALDEITAFSLTFCRSDTDFSRGRPIRKNIKVYFLGIWDCVSSVAVLESKAPIPVPVTGTAHYVRHAVAVDERRVKFKAALLAQDVRTSRKRSDEDIKEVWFPGCHGDVGGGWPCVKSDPLDNKEKMTVWQRIKNFWTSRKPQGPSKDIDDEWMQMSDIPLHWMISELELVGRKDPSAAVHWSQSVYKFKKKFQEKKMFALQSVYHDSLAFGYGTSFFRVLLWWFMEYLPIITRWELAGGEWVNTRFPLNAGGTRDIPPDAVLHESLIWRLYNMPGYRPTNDHGDNTMPCLLSKDSGNSDKFKKKTSGNEIEIASADPDHTEYVFAGAYV